MGQIYPLSGHGSSALVPERAYLLAAAKEMPGAINEEELLLASLARRPVGSVVWRMFANDQKLGKSARNERVKSAFCAVIN